jgi:hypothetical protein
VKADAGEHFTATATAGQIDRAQPHCRNPE